MLVPLPHPANHGCPLVAIEIFGDLALSQIRHERSQLTPCLVTVFLVTLENLFRDNLYNRHSTWRRIPLFS
jgi:hypothetical protein